MGSWDGLYVKGSRINKRDDSTKLTVSTMLTLLVFSERQEMISLRWLLAAVCVDWKYQGQNQSTSRICGLIILLSPSVGSSAGSSAARAVLALALANRLVCFLKCCVCVCGGFGGKRLSALESSNKPFHSKRIAWVFSLPWRTLGICLAVHTVIIIGCNLN